MGEKTEANKKCGVSFNTDSEGVSNKQMRTEGCQFPWDKGTSLNYAQFRELRQLIPG